MNWVTETTQQKMIDLGKGLFCIRYEDAEDQASPPRVVVKPASGHERSVELLLHPDSHDSTLWGPGTSLVVRTTSAAKLQVEVVPSRPNGSRVASVRVEPLTQGAPPRTGYGTSAGSEFGFESAAFDGLRVLGHVAGIGDVSVNANEWIAGPTAPSRVEGISIYWPNRPRGLDVRYAVKTAAQTGVAKMVELDSFAGTRGRALPVTGIVIELSGPAACTAQIVAEAAFLSAPILRAIGQRVVLSGPTGREPLVGLRLAIQSSTVAAGHPLVGDESEIAARSDQRYPAASTKGKVRVFRSRPPLSLAAN
jgi:hypothetical protein